MAEACLNLGGTMPTNCYALQFPCRLHFFFSEQHYSGKHYVLRESAKSP